VCLDLIEQFAGDAFVSPSIVKHRFFEFEEELFSAEETGVGILMAGSYPSLQAFASKCVMTARYPDGYCLVVRVEWLRTDAAIVEDDEVVPKRCAARREVVVLWLGESAV
jgi:hypothetical protein